MNRLALICLGISFIARAAAANPIGAVYPIVEPDALLEFEQAAAGKVVSAETFGDSNNWGATQSHTLPSAVADRTRSVVPFFALPFDIPDGRGNILYPKGFTFNPLEHLFLPNVLWIVREEHLDWAFERAAETDMIILAGGNALKESEARRRPVFVLRDALAARLDLQAAPSRVWQDGTVLKVREFAVADTDDAPPDTINTTAGEGSE